MLETGNSPKQENAEKYRVSIRFASGGLSFLGHIPHVGDSFFSMDVRFEDGNLTYAASVAACFEAHPFFSWEYKSVQILVSSARYVLVPDVLFSEDSMEASYASVFKTRGEKIFASHVAELSAQVVFGLDEDIYNLCEQRWANCAYTHAVACLLRLEQEQCHAKHLPRMYAVGLADSIALSCFVEGKLLYANSFPATEINNMLYYILSIWQKHGLSQLNDLLFVSGVSEGLQKGLLEFIPHVRPIDVPTDAYLFGSVFLKAPMDVIALYTFKC